MGFPLAFELSSENAVSVSLSWVVKLFKPQRQTLTSSRSATAVGNNSSRQATVSGMGNLHLSELWSEITALGC